MAMKKTNWLDELSAALFGKHAKILLLLFGIMACFAYGNHPSHYGKAIIGSAFIFTAFYLSVHERNDQ
jgi:hypothetical protein